MDVNVIVIEDNSRLRNMIIEVLKLESYNAFGANSIAETKDILNHNVIEIALVDIMLPDGKGYNLINTLRKHNIEMYIIMITAIDEIESKKICYNYGADDYITKPFDIGVLKLKLNNLRNRIINNRDIFVIGDIIVNTKEMKIKCNNIEISIQNVQLEILKELFLHGEIKIENDIDENKLRVSISRTRKEIRLVQSKKVKIKSTYGTKGYKLVIKDEEK